MLDLYGQTIVEKSQVSMPPPGLSTRFAIMGAKKYPNDIIDFTRRTKGAEHYEMYKQHPVVKAAIEKKAQYAVAAGWQFKTSELVSPGEKVDKTRQKALEIFFRNSNAKQLFRTTFRDMDIYGESFWVIIRSLSDRRIPLKAMRLNPRFMTEKTNAGFLTGWKYGPIATTEDSIDYDVDEIIHFKLDDPENEFRGLSPLHSLERAVAQDIYAMEYNQKFFENSAQTGIIFIVKNSDGNEAKRNREWIEQNYAGPSNAHRPLLIEGDVVVEQSVAKSAEMEFLAGRKLLRSEILMVLEMDPDKVGIHEDSNRSVSKETGEAFHSETIWPRQAIVEEPINNDLILGIFGWEDILFEFKEGDPRRRQELADTRDKDLKSGRETLNEQREAMGLPAIAGGEDAFIMTPQGAVLVSDLAASSAAIVDRAAANNSPTDTARKPLTARQAEEVSQKADG